MYCAVQVKFSRPCPCPAVVRVVVTLGRVRRLTRAEFSVESDKAGAGAPYCTGTAACWLPPAILHTPPPPA